MEKGVVPTNFKLAYVRPLLKKPGLDPDILNYHRPVSSLSFLGKQAEGVVGSRLTEHMTILVSSSHFMQSAYRSNYSCETPLFRLQNDIPRAMDKQEVGIRVQLDLSCAFDTVNLVIIFEKAAEWGGPPWNSPRVVQVLPREQTPAH